MRELKLRAWDEGKLVMHENFQFIKSGEDGNDWIVFISDIQQLSHRPHPFENPYFQQQLKIMQYTGLKDKNGVEIYEGDIVRKHEFIGFVEFKRGAFVLSGDVLLLAHFGNTLEIIGNIYENRELLNG